MIVEDATLEDPIAKTIPWSLLRACDDPKSLWIIAKTEIDKNSEMLLDYGTDSYWNRFDNDVEHTTETADGHGMCCPAENSASGAVDAACGGYQCIINRPPPCWWQPDRRYISVSDLDSQATKKGKYHSKRER